jgi:hypothetical protein
MPIWLRKFTFSEIDKFYKEEKSAYDNALEWWRWEEKYD